MSFQIITIDSENLIAKYITHVRKFRKTSGYYITIPKIIVNNLGLEKGVKVKVTIEVK